MKHSPSAGLGVMRPDAPILLTGFDPFAGLTRNPSAEAAAALHGARIGGRAVVSACLPVSFSRSPSALRELLLQHEPALTLCTGLSFSRNFLSIERVALNYADARTVDNDGYRAVDEPVRAGAPAAYFSNLPVKAMAARLRDAGYIAEVTLSAGSYVCNAVFYTLMHALQERPNHLGGFIHVPPLVDGQPAVSGALDLEQLIQGLRLALETACSVQQDIPIGIGKED